MNKKQELKSLYINLNDIPEEQEIRAEEFDGWDDDKISKFELEHFGVAIPTVSELRQAGYRVWVQHHRRILGKGMKTLKEWRQMGIPASHFYAKGGKTKVEILSPDGQTYTGNSVCSRVDNFNRKAGLAVAIFRSSVIL